LRFDLAALEGKVVHRAFLSLSTGGKELLGDKRIRCREVLAPWQPATVHFFTRDGTVRWTSADYGEALVEVDAEPHLGCKQWDATRAVARSLEKADSTLSLHLSGGTYPHMNVFQGPECENPAHRPRLTVVLDDSSAPASK